MRIELIRNTTQDRILNSFNDDYKEDHLEGYISAGINNDWFIEINSLIAKSPVHASALSAKVDMIAGQGIQQVDDLKFNEFVFNKFHTDTCYEIAKKCTEDLEIFGGFAIKIYLNELRQVAQLEHVPVHKLRFKNRDCKRVLYSEDWFDISLKNIGYPIYKKYDKFSSKYNHYIVYVDGSLNNLSTYPRPDYHSIIPYVLTEQKIAQYHYSIASNGYTLGGHLNIPTSITNPEEMEVLTQKFKDQHKGVGNAGDIMVTFSDSTGNVPSFTPINGNDSDEMYLSALNKIEEKIAQGHRMPISLIGIDAAGKSLISNGDELLNQLESFKSTYVRPKQKLIEDTFNMILGINQIEPLFKLNEFNLVLPKKIDANLIIGIVSNTTINTETKKVLLKMEGMSDEDIIKIMGE